MTSESSTELSASIAVSRLVFRAIDVGHASFSEMMIAERFEVRITMNIEIQKLIKTSLEIHTSWHSAPCLEYSAAGCAQRLYRHTLPDFVTSFKCLCVGILQMLRRICAWRDDTFRIRCSRCRTCIHSYQAMAITGTDVTYQPDASTIGRQIDLERALASIGSISEPLQHRRCAGRSIGKRSTSAQYSFVLTCISPWR